MKFKELSAYLLSLEKTTSRNEMTNILAEIVTKTSKDEIDKTVNLILGQLAPNYKGIVFNIAERMMIQIISKAYGVEANKVKKLYKEKGDLGNVAAMYAENSKFQIPNSKQLSVIEVYERLMEIANEEGVGSQERKVEKTAKLLSNLDPLSAKYVARIPVGKLRLGFSDMTILDALSVMLKGDKSVRKELEQAFNVTADIGKIALRVKEKGLKGLTKVIAEPGTPIRPSLAERLPSAEKIFEKVGKTVAIEPKYDGFRSQVHLLTKNGQKEVRIFSRNLENTTHMFPDLVEAAKKIPVESAIFDGEAIAYNEKEDKFFPFQETVQRKRKHGIEEAVKKHPLVLFVFDILYKNGKTLLDRTFSERRKILEETVKGKVDGTIRITDQVIVSDAKTMRDLIAKYFSEGLEGGLIKKIDVEYKAGARGYHWVKYKKSTEEGLADTIDCVVMGINKGRGKRVGFGVGAFLIGIREERKYKTVSKIGTGLSDEQWRELDARAKKLEVREKPKEYEVDKNIEPDTWLKPSLVVEIMADEITKSPIHTAGRKEGRGFALRFPRLVRFRDDKNPEQSTNISELKKLYDMQKVK